MTDRQLLEDAAKAAGIEYGWQHIFSDYEGSTADTWDWNPLTSDGDALRLAVLLQIHMQPDSRYAWASTYSVNATEEVGENPYAATRRAITRAAAEIGRAMP